MRPTKAEEDRKWKEGWERLVARGVVDVLGEPRHYASSLASVHDAERGRNRRMGPRLEVRDM